MNIAFTGHRPQALGGYDWNCNKNKLIRKKLYNTILDVVTASEENNINFITGGALGVDQYAFEVCSFLKRETFRDERLKGKVITQTIAVPFEEQPNAWYKSTDIERYKNQLERADAIVYVDTIPEYSTKEPVGKYSKEKLNFRNKYMVDNCDILVSVFNGKKSGTGSCVNYAKSKGIKIFNINPDLL